MSSHRIMGWTYLALSVLGRGSGGGFGGTETVCAMARCAALSEVKGRSEVEQEIGMYLALPVGAGDSSDPGPSSGASKRRLHVLGHFSCGCDEHNVPIVPLGVDADIFAEPRA